MALSISGWRKGNKSAETTEVPAQTESPAQSSAEAVGVKQIGAVVEKLKTIRARLRNNKRVEAWRAAEQGISDALYTINLKASNLAKNRAQFLLEGRDPDTELRRVGEEKKQIEQNVKDLKAAALRELGCVHREYATIVNAVAPIIWNEWRQLRKELLAMLERWGDFDERLGVPVASLAREAEQFNTAFGDVRRDMPSSGSLQAPVQVPRLGRGWDWDTFNKVVVAIRQWLV